MAAQTAPVPVMLSVAGLLAATPFGISVETIAVGMGFAIVGLMGRFAFEVQKSLETGNGVKLAATLGWVGAGLVGAPFLTVLWLMFLKWIGIQADVVTVIGLLILGFSGPKGLTWLITAATDMLASRLPGRPKPPAPPGGTP